MVFDTNIITSKFLKFERNLRRLRETGPRSIKSRLTMAILSHSTSCPPSPAKEYFHFNTYSVWSKGVFLSLNFKLIDCSVQFLHLFQCRHNNTITDSVFMVKMWRVNGVAMDTSRRQILPYLPVLVPKSTATPS